MSYILKFVGPEKPFGLHEKSSCFALGHHCCCRSARGSSRVFSKELSTSGLRISESCFDTTTLRETEGFPDGDRV